MSERQLQRQRDRYAQLVARGVCTYCRVVAVSRPGELCASCRKRTNAARRDAARTRAEARRRADAAVRDARALRRSKRVLERMSRPALTARGRERARAKLGRHLEAIGYWHRFAGVRDV